MSKPIIPMFTTWLVARMGESAGGGPLSRAVEL